MQPEESTLSPYKIALGLVCTLIFLSLTTLLILLLSKPQLTLPYISISLGIFIIAVWFGTVAFRLLTKKQVERSTLLSLLEVKVIFLIFGVSGLIGTTRHFLINDLESAFVSLLIVLMMFPAYSYTKESIIKATKEGSN